MPWPLIAGLVAKVGAGALASGAGAAAGGAGATAAGTTAATTAAGGIGGAATGGGGLMGKMGGMMSGGGGGGGGGMMSKAMGMIPMPHKTSMAGLMANSGASRGPSVQPGSNPNASAQRDNENPNRPWLRQQANKGGKIKMQNGGMLDPGFFDYLSKVTGQGASPAPQVQAPVEIPDNFMQQPENPGPVDVGVGAGQGTAVENPPASPTAAAMAPMPGATPPPAMPKSMGGPDQTVDPANQTVGEVNQPGSGPADTGKMGDPLSTVTGLMSSNKGQYETDERGVTVAPDSGEAVGASMDKLKKGNVLGAAAGMMSHIVGKQSALRRQKREEEQWGSQMEQAQKHSSVYNDPNSVYYAAKDGASIDPSLAKQNNNLVGMMAYQNGGNTFDPEVGRQADLNPQGSLASMMQNDSGITPVQNLRVRENKRKMVSKGVDSSGKKFKMVTKKLQNGGSTVGEKRKSSSEKKEVGKRFNELTVGEKRKKSSEGGLINKMKK